MVSNIVWHFWILSIGTLLSSTTCKQIRKIGFHCLRRRFPERQTDMVLGERALLQLWALTDSSRVLFWKPVFQSPVLEIPGNPETIPKSSGNPSLQTRFLSAIHVTNDIRITIAFCGNFGPFVW